MKTEREKDENKSSTMNLIDDCGCSVQGSEESYRSSTIFAFLLHYYILSLTFIHRICSKKDGKLFNINNIF